MFKLATYLLTLVVITSPMSALARDNVSPYFYKVTKNGSVSYLLGTIHRNVSLSDLSPAITDALHSSDVIAVEVQFSERMTQLFFENPWKYRETFEHDFLGISSDQRTKELPSPETLRKLVALNFPQKLLGFVRNDMCDLVADSRIDFGNPRSVDFEVLKHAYSTRKAIIQLDSESIVKDLKANSEDHFACNLNGFVSRASVEELQEDYEQMRSDYLGQNLMGLEDFGLELDIVERNQFWIPRLSEILTNRNTFVAVGVGHLYGNNGVIRLLQTNGFNVTPVD